MIYRMSLVLMALLATAVAFVPNKMLRTTKALMIKPVKAAIEEVGVLPPTGFWDPLGRRMHFFLLNFINCVQK